MGELISVIVPIYRVEQYLVRCIESICRQTYKNLEIILVDDGSDDACPQICDDYSGKDHRIKVIHKQNGGLSDARNAGIAVAKGKFFAFVDSDDRISEHFIEYLYKALLDTSADVAQCDFTDYAEKPPIFSEEYVKPVIFTKQQMLKNLTEPDMNICSTVIWSKLYKAELFSNFSFPYGKLHEDEFTTYKIFDHCKKIAYLDARLYGYYKNDKGIIQSQISSQRLDGIEALLERYQYYGDRKYQELKKITANQIFEAFLQFDRPVEEIADPGQFEKRRNQLYHKFKDNICFNDLYNRYEIIARASKTYKQMQRYYKVYLRLGKISKTTGLSKLKRFYQKKRRESVYKSECNRLLKGYSPENTVFILGSIEYDNLGDHAIVYAQRKFLEYNMQNCFVIEIRDELYVNMRHYLKKHISPKSVLTIPGGGNMGNLWIDDERRRRMIIEDFPKNKIIVFPQTMEYTKDCEGEEELQKSIAIYNKHRSLILCAREEESYRRMKEAYPNCKVILLPDIVLSLPVRKDSRVRTGALCCFRADKERLLDDLKVETIKRALLKNYAEVEEISTISPVNIPYQQRKAHLDKLWNQISHTQLLVTDRLHGMIFAYLMDTTCIVLANNNHKICGTYEKWLKDCDYIVMSKPEGIDNAIRQVEERKIEEKWCVSPDLFRELRELLTDE